MTPQSVSKNMAYMLVIMMLVGTGCLGGLNAVSLDGEDSSDKKTDKTNTPKTNNQPTPKPGELLFGATLAHRLNALEYTNSINHLFKLEIDFGQQIPRQTPGDGFLNVASKIVMAPGDMEDYLKAAKRVTLEINQTPDAKTYLMSPCSGEDDTSRECAEAIVQTFLPRIWRGQVTLEETSDLMALFDEAQTRGISFEERIAMLIQTALISPKFLFRTHSFEDKAVQGPRKLTDVELASRLSYFLWSSTPDDELLELAKQGMLSDPDVLEAQVERMLTDDQARYASLGRQFFEAWLGLDRLRLRGGDAEKIQASLDESSRMFWHVLANNLPFHELLTADYMFINKNNAAFYQYDEPMDFSWMQVNIDSDVQGPRRGVLGQRAFLSRYAGVVFRGVAINKHILCTDLHVALPDDVLEKLNAQSTKLLTGEISELTSIAQRRDDPVCAGCHAKIDSAGYSLFEFDNQGIYRTEDEKGKVIDPSVVLSDTLAYDDGASFIESFKDNPKIEQCMVRRVLGYATGREVGAVEDEAVKQLWTDWKAKGLGLRTLIKSMATSQAFLTRDSSNIVILEKTHSK